VKSVLGSKFDIRYEEEYKGKYPDVMVFSKSNGTAFRKHPLFIFEATIKRGLLFRGIHSKKRKQVKSYQKLAHTFLVIPPRLNAKPFYLYGTFFVLTSNYLEDFLIFLRTNTKDFEDSFLSDEPRGYFELFFEFLFILGKKVYKCPFCSSGLFYISLLHCSQYDHYFHPD